jgi:hypothetical protein
VDRARTMNQQNELLEELQELVTSDRLIGRGDSFFRQSSELVEHFLATGDLSPADDPLQRGRSAARRGV